MFSRISGDRLGSPHDLLQKEEDEDIVIQPKKADEGDEAPGMESGDGKNNPAEEIAAVEK